MCQAISLIVTKSKKVYWEAGIDSHDQLVEKFKKKDKELIDDKEPPYNTFARIEIVPKNGNYLKPKQKWIYQIDERVKPKWLTKNYEKLCRQAEKEWKKQVYTFNLKEALKPIYPFKIKPPTKITSKHIKLLKNWASVWESVRGSVWESVGASVGDSVRGSVWESVGTSVWESVGTSVWESVWKSVGDSVWESVWKSVWESVRGSVWASVGAYIGSLFPNIKKWEYVDYRNKLFKKNEYPFQSVVNLWKMGLVPTNYDGKIWKLHGGKNADVLWKGTVLF